MYILAGCWYFNASLYWHWVSSWRTTCKQLVYDRKMISTLPCRVLLTDQFNNLSFPLSSTTQALYLMVTETQRNRNLVKSTTDLLDETAVTEREDLVEMTELPRLLGIKIFWHQAYPLSRVTHLSGMNYTAVDLPALLLLPHALPLNRKSMSHFALLSSSLWWLLPSFFHSSFFLVSWSFWRPLLLFLPLLLLSVFFLFSRGHCVLLPFPLRWSALTSTSLFAFLLSLVSMGTVPGCHGDSLGKVMLSHGGGLSWQQISGCSPYLLPSVM